MKHLFGMALLATLALSPEFAYAAKCKFVQNAMDPDSGIYVVQTKWDRLVSIMSVQSIDTELEATGEVSVIGRGDERFLTLRIDTGDYYALPPELTTLPDPTWHPEYRDFLDMLLGDSVIFPAGTSLRIDLDDQTSVVLRTTEHRRIRADYTLPGHMPEARNNSEKAAKGLVGFLGKVIEKTAEKQGFEADETTEGSRNYLVRSTAVLEFPLDDESADILSRAAVTSMRVESRDRYYTLGLWKTQDSVVTWGKKSYDKVRNAMQCVNNVTKDASS